MLMIEKSIGQSAINLSRHDSFVSIHSATVIPHHRLQGQSRQVMGMEMTPIASQEPSRTPALLTSAATERAAVRACLKQRESRLIPWSKECGCSSTFTWNKLF